MSDITNQVALVALGWLLGVLSQGIERRRQEYLERRRVLTRLDRILTTVAIEIEVRRELSDGRVLPKPPRLPEDFDRVVDQLGDWEARRGEYGMHSSLLTLKSLVERTREWHTTLEGREGAPESSSSFYIREVKEVKDMTWRLLSGVQDAQLSLIGHIKKRLRRKSPEKPGMRVIQEEQVEQVEQVQFKSPNPAAPADQKASLSGR